METRLSALALGLLFVVNLIAAEPDHESLVRAAIDRIYWDFQTDWAYTETSEEDGIETVGRFDPSHEVGQQWQLLRYDDRAPTAEERDAYHERKDFSHLDAQDGDGLAAIIRFDSLELIDEGASFWEFGFHPNVGADADEAAFLDLLRGTLRVSKLTKNLISLELRNRDSIRPVIGTKISRLSTRFEFGEVALNGPSVLKLIDVQVRGRALMLVEFDERERSAFSEFTFVGDPTVAATSRD